jgi:hypothetical protein
MPDLEKRYTRRYKLSNPVDFWWLAPSGSVQAGHGMTLDISSGGVMIVARKCPPKGVRIQTTIRIAQHNESDRPLELHGEGIVIRIAPGKATRPSQRPSGFAATMHFYTELSNVSSESNKETSDRYKHLHCLPR